MKHALLVFLLCLVLLLCPALVSGQTGDDGKKESNWEFSFTNYLKLAGYYDHLKDDAVINPDNILQKEDYGSTAEANTQIKAIYRDDYAFYADVGYQYSPGPGIQEDRDTHFITNEMFFDLFINEWFYFKFGKKRETWGVGNLVSPIDIINPPKDPVDAAESRGGTYLALFEIPIRNSTFSFVYFPATELDEHGLPESSTNETEALLEDDFGFRSYFLVFDTDISFIYFRKDIIPTLMKDYYGLAVTKYYGDLGLYFDSLGHKGKDTEFIRWDPVNEAYYWPQNTQLVNEASQDNEFIFNFSTGLDYVFLDDTKINLEYHRNEDGYSLDQYDYFYDFLDNDYYGYYNATSDDARDAIAGKIMKGASLLETNLRRNYLAIYFQRPSTFDDFFPRLLFNTCLDDGSFLFNAALDYNAGERTTFTFDIKSFIGSEDSEYGMLPDDYRFTLKVKYYF